jgi:hypothetical protein
MTELLASKVEYYKMGSIRVYFRVHGEIANSRKRKAATALEAHDCCSEAAADPIF